MFVAVNCSYGTGTAENSYGDDTVDRRVSTIGGVAVNRNVIIVGGGRVGRHAAEELNETRDSVTIVEKDIESSKGLRPQDVSLLIEGSGTDREVLERANPDEADVIAALTNDTATNLAVCELARELNPDIRTIVRIASDGERDHAHLSYVDSVVYPEAAAGRLAFERITAE